MEQKRFANIIIVIVGVIILAGVVGYFILLKNSHIPTPAQSIVTEEESQTENGTDKPHTSSQNEFLNTASWKLYQNKEYGFEIKYPREWEVKPPGVAIYFVDGDFIQFAVLFHKNDSMERALKIIPTPQLERTTLANFPALIGEGFDERGTYGLLTYVQRQNDRFEFYRSKSPFAKDYKSKILSWRNPEFPNEEVKVPLLTKEDKILFDTLLSTLKFI